MSLCVGSGRCTTWAGDKRPQETSLSQRLPQPQTRKRRRQACPRRPPSPRCRRVRSPLVSRRAWLPCAPCFSGSAGLWPLLAMTGGCLGRPSKATLEDKRGSQPPRLRHSKSLVLASGSLPRPCICCLSGLQLARVHQPPLQGDWKQSATLSIQTHGTRSQHIRALVSPGKIRS